MLTTKFIVEFYPIAAVIDARRQTMKGENNQTLKMTIRLYDVHLSKNRSLHMVINADV